ncbi:DUF7527 domain-containing protein [Halorubrum trueperi]|uniref:DUF7527 domain-containing protein n=1 Tax=Halorubrum trueperi TaxID=2004704 RepID=A0ABD5UQU7_9EURY
MDAQRRAEITGWDARAFSDGFGGLNGLVDREFSGAVTDGTAWLFVFEGRVIGVVDGDLDGFADASGTVYEAPNEALPVLFAMQEQGGEPRAQYYTNDTPLSEADRKLSKGGFTGYVELSENVLSGDYYVTYTAGESMAAAYVGNSRRLETGDDAFDLADDEVGIYTVYEVDLNVRELPEGATETGSADASAPTGTGSGDGDRDDDRAADESSGPDKSDESSESDESRQSDDSGVSSEFVESDESDGSGEPGESEPEPSGSKDDEDPGGEPSAVKGADRDVVAATEQPDPEPADAASIETDAADRNEPPGPTGSSGSANSIDAEAAASDDNSASRPAGDASRHPENDDVFSEEAQWREQKSIPALDPSEASDPPSERSKERADASGRGSRNSRESRDSRRSRNSERSTGGNRSTGGDGRSERDAESPEPRSTGQSGRNRSAVSQRSTKPETIGRAEERVRQLESSLDEAKTERDELSAERDEIASERDDLATEIDRLESEVSTLREERDRLREQLSDARERLPESERTLSPAEARSGTNLFVRYDSKGGATLEDAHGGTVDREALRENLRIEHHTSFETEGLVVDGRPYEEFLRETIEYGFTRWLVEDLPFEVSGTGNQSVLRDLYDALPEVDRAEIGGSVSIAIRENGEETREQRTFDLVLRDRMGNPLFVADLNDSRDPTAEGTLESLVENGRDIAESNEPFAAAFAVTESFFEPGALETASDAVGGGLFSRSKRASFVKLSRKRGYHLCLVEARDGGFHMTVPDL